ncbi:ROK family protein [Rheinheimera sp.]|uniref:ROK family protein n=1 Tax=Rheinheimera sp. TaxID=1869214 RepID=UPI003D2D1456
MIYGLDIGGTKIEIAVFDEQFVLAERWRVPTPTTDYVEFLDTVQAQIELADAKFGAKAPVGIALPGVVAAQGLVISSNVACLNQQQVGVDLTALLQRPVAIGNDCRLFVLSEALLGAGRGFSRVFGVILGTGAGGGLCVDGQIYQGRHQLAGELGHQSIAARVLMQYQLPLYRCGCGLDGCAETYISGTGLARLYSHFSQQDNTTYDWLQALRRAEPVAQHCFACYLDALGAALAAQVLAYDPDVLVIGGGLSDIDEIFQALPGAIGRHLFSGVTVPPVRRAEYGAASGERGAAILGARLAA